jgi:tetratricopeptide (TPR) repeat protein
MAWTLALVAATAAGGADPPGTPASRAAVERCHAAAELPPSARVAAYGEALAAGDAAIAADDGDALAHFASFCALGGMLQERGISLSAPSQLRRLRREVDRTLELAPDFADALAGKGALLLGTPWLLGGDAAEGERYLRRALEVDPDYLTPRFDLVRALRARGATDDARREATQALAIAERKGSRADVERAHAELDALGPPTLEPPRHPG